MDQVRLEVRKRTTPFIEGLKTNPPSRIPGTAIVLGRITQGVPLALLQKSQAQLRHARKSTSRSG
jgi:KUP system potassium uptake protein